MYIVIIFVPLDYISHVETPVFFFFNDTATTEIYTLSLHDALPISSRDRVRSVLDEMGSVLRSWLVGQLIDRKSTRLNSSHANISYAVFCLKKKKRSL